MAKAANQLSFKSVLDETVSDDKSWDAPIPLPVGTYNAMVQSYRQDKSTEKQTDFIEFTLKILSAHGDVDEDALEEAGGLKDRTIRDTYYITDNSKFRLKQFWEILGLDPVGKSISQNCNDSLNQELVISIRHKPSKDGQGVFAEIRSRAKAQ